MERLGGCQVANTLQSEMEYATCNLCTLSSPPPVIDCFQYANTEGENLGDLTTSVELLVNHLCLLHCVIGPVNCKFMVSSLTPDRHLLSVVVSKL